MYRISEILYGGRNYQCVSFKSLSVRQFVFVVCKDDESGKEITAVVSDINGSSKEFFLDYIAESCGIKEIMGVGEDFIYVFGKHELELLSYLDFYGYIDDDENKSQLLYELDDRLHMSFILGEESMTITDVLLKLYNCYKVCDDILKIFTSNSDTLTYKISNVSKFNVLLTKLITLGVR